VHHVTSRLQKAKCHWGFVTIFLGLVLFIFWIILSSINLTIDGTVFASNILKNCGNPIYHKICYCALCFAKGVFLHVSKCCCSWNIVQENNGSLLIIFLREFSLLMLTAETKRVSCELRIDIDHERAIYRHTHSTPGWNFRIISQVGYKHTFCEHFVSTTNCFFLYILTKITYPYSKTNVTRFSFNLLIIKASICCRYSSLADWGHGVIYMFRALLAHPQETPHKRHMVYSVGVMSVERSSTDIPW
jgi:hypothetical protein